MITSVAVKAYLTRIGQLLMGQGFTGIFRDPSVSENTLKNMRVVYDSEDAMTEEWLSDELASTKMKRKGTTTKDDVRSGPFMALFWKRSSLEPIVRQRYHVLDTPEGQSAGGLYGRSTVSASFTIACVFVSNKAEAIEDLEEAFAAVFQNTYNMPLSLQYIYNTEDAAKKVPINFTFIQNMGEADEVNFKEGNLFAYSWSAKIFMNYVSEFAWTRVFPVEKVVVDLYGPNGIALGSLDAAGIAHTHDYTADTGEVVPKVPDEPLVAFTRGESHDYVPFAITLPYSVPYYDGSEGTPEGTNPAYMPSVYGISDEARELIGDAIKGIGGEVSLRSTKYMMVVRMPLSLNHKEDATYDEDLMATAGAVSAAIHSAASDDYIVTPMPPEE